MPTWHLLLTQHGIIDKSIGLTMINLSTYSTVNADVVWLLVNARINLVIYLIHLLTCMNINYSSAIQTHIHKVSFRHPSLLAAPEI